MKNPLLEKTPRLTARGRLIVSEYRNGATTVELAKRFNLSRHHVVAAIQTAGLSIRDDRGRPPADVEIERECDGRR